MMKQEVKVPHWKCYWTEGGQFRLPKREGGEGGP